MRKIKPVGDEIPRDLHRLLRRRGILKHPGVRHHPGVDRHRDRLIDQLMIDRAVHELTGARRLGHDVVDLAGSLIRHMVVDVHRVTRLIKNRLRLADPVLDRIQADKEVIHIHIRFVGCVDPLNLLNIGKRRRHLFQKDVHAQSGVRLFQIVVHAHAAADAVAVRADVSADGDRPGLADMIVDLKLYHKSLIRKFCSLSSNFVFNSFSLISQNGFRTKLILHYRSYSLSPQCPHAQSSTRGLQSKPPQSFCSY